MSFDDGRFHGKMLNRNYEKERNFLGLLNFLFILFLQTHHCSKRNKCLGFCFYRQYFIDAYRITCDEI